MSGAVAIARREVWDRRMVLAAAAVAGLLPFATPLLPGVRPDDAQSAIQVSALVLALGLGFVLAVAFGATAIGRDLGNRRIGFDLARPIGDLSIWAGRLGAALILSAAAMAIVVGPALLAALATGGLRLPDDAPPLGVAAVLAAGLLLLVPLAHVLGVAFRSRSRWLVADVAGAAVVLVIALTAIRRLIDVSAYRSALALEVAGVVAAIPMLWVASAVQLKRGRGDIVAGHRAQSLVLWPLLLVVALGLVSYAAWFVAVEPTDLVEFAPEGAGRGPWIAVTGTAAGREDYEPTFLLNPDTGRSILLGASPWLRDAILFSGDGTRAIWLDRDPGGVSTVTVHTLDLTLPDAAPRETTVRFSALMSPVRAAVSSSGRYLAGIQHDTLAVHDLDDGRIVASVRVPADESRGRSALAFSGERAVRLYANGEAGLLVHELNLVTKSVRSFEATAFRGDWIHWLPDHDRLLVIRGWGRAAAVLDGDDGAVLWRLPEVPEGLQRSIDFLADGRVVTASAGEGAPPTLVIYGRDGEVQRRVEFPGVARVPALGYEIEPGRVLVGFADRDPVHWVDRRLFAVHVDSGAVDSVADTGALPLHLGWSPGWAPPTPGSARSRLLFGDECSVELLDPSDLSTRRILGGTCPARAEAAEATEGDAATDG